MTSLPASYVVGRSVASTNDHRPVVSVQSPHHRQTPLQSIPKPATMMSAAAPAPATTICAAAFQM